MNISWPICLCLLPLFALHFNALSSLIRGVMQPVTLLLVCRALRTPNWPSIQTSWFFSVLFFHFYWILLPHASYLGCPLTTTDQIQIQIQRNNPLLPRRSVLHYAGTYVLKFHSCVGFFFIHYSNLCVCVCVWWGSWKGHGGTYVARLPRTGAAALSFDLGFAFFTRRGPTPNPHAIAFGEGPDRIGGARNGFHFCWCRDFFLVPCKNSPDNLRVCMVHKNYIFTE